jgi:hypothetical protein
MDMETLAGTYRILAGARIYAADFGRALQRGNTTAARHALDDLEAKTQALRDNTTLFDNEAVKREIGRFQIALLDSNEAADELLGYLEAGGRPRSRQAVVLADRWISAGDEANRMLHMIPTRIAPHLSSDQREQLEPAPG